jgi:hypothetical protein
VGNGIPQVKQYTYIEVADARLEGNDWSSYGHGGKMADVCCVREDVKEEEEWEVVDGGQAAKKPERKTRPVRQLPSQRFLARTCTAGSLHPPWPQAASALLAPVGSRRLSRAVIGRAGRACPPKAH